MKNKNFTTGLSFGSLIGLVYCLLLFWRWSVATNLIMFAATALLGFLIIVGLMIYESFYRRKVEGGFITMKNLFQTLFVSVLLFEFIYATYNYLHLKYIDPNVIENMKASMLSMIDKTGATISEEERANSVERFEKLKEATEFTSIVKSFLISISTSGIIALIISLVMKKEKPVFETITE